jgi:hypothetical protein
MEVTIRMNSKVYNSLMKEAIETAIKTTIDIAEKKINSLNFYSGTYLMKMFGYSNKNSLKRRLRDDHIPYRILGDDLYVSVSDINTLLETTKKMYG